MSMPDVFKRVKARTSRPPRPSGSSRVFGPLDFAPGMRMSLGAGLYWNPTAIHIHMGVSPIGGLSRSASSYSPLAPFAKIPQAPHLPKHRARGRSTGRAGRPRTCHAPHRNWQWPSIEDKNTE